MNSLILKTYFALCLQFIVKNATNNLQIQNCPLNLFISYLKQFQLTITSTDNYIILCNIQIFKCNENGKDTDNKPEFLIHSRLTKQSCI